MTPYQSIVRLIPENDDSMIRSPNRNMKMEILIRRDPQLRVVGLFCKLLRNYTKLIEKGTVQS